MMLQRCGQLVELNFSNHLLLKKPTPRILHELKQEHAPPMPQRVYMHQSVHTNIVK